MGHNVPRFCLTNYVQFDMNWLDQLKIAFSGPCYRLDRSRHEDQDDQKRGKSCF